MKKSAKQKKFAKIVTEQADEGLGTQEIDLYGTNYVKDLLGVNTFKSYSKNISNPLTSCLPIGKKVFATIDGLEIKNDVVDNLSTGVKFGIDAISIIGNVGISKLINERNHPDNYDASQIHGMSYLTDCLDNLSIGKKLGTDYYQMDVYSRNLFKPINSFEHLGGYDGVAINRNGINYSGLNNASLRYDFNGKLNNRLTSHLLSLIDNTQKYTPITNGIANHLLPNYSLLSQAGDLTQVYLGLKGTHAGLINHSGLTINYPLQHCISNYRVSLPHTLKAITGDLRIEPFSNGSFPSFAGINSLQLTASIAPQSINAFCTGGYRHINHLGLSNLNPSAAIIGETLINPATSYALLEMNPYTLQSVQTLKAQSNLRLGIDFSQPSIENFQGLNHQKLPYYLQKDEFVISNGTICNGLEPMLSHLYHTDHTAKFVTALTRGLPSDFSVVSGALNSVPDLTKSLRWHPEISGGIWKDETAKILKQENDEIAQLKSEVLGLKNEIKHLRYSLEQVKDGQTHLINRKISAAEKKIQLVLTASTSQSTTAILENASEDLIDRYDVMKMLNISESTYYRFKKNWTAYQIGSKKLYKASEIKAHLKNFRK